MCIRDSEKTDHGMASLNLSLHNQEKTWEIAPQFLEVKNQLFEIALVVLPHHVDVDGSEPESGVSAGCWGGTWQYAFAVASADEIVAMDWLLLYEMCIRDSG